MAVKKTALMKEQEKSAVYTKEQFLESGLYQDRRDLVRALLEDGKVYSCAEAEDMIDKYMKGKVR